MFRKNINLSIFIWILVTVFFMYADSSYAQRGPAWCLKIATTDGKYSGTDAYVTVRIYNQHTSISRILNIWETDDLEPGEIDTYYLCKADSISCFSTDSSNIPSHIGFQNFDNDGWQMEWYTVYMANSSDCRVGIGQAYLRGFYDTDGPDNIWLDGDGDQQELFSTFESGFPTDEEGYIPALTTETNQECYKDNERVNCVYE